MQMLTIILDSSQLIISLTLCHTQQLCNLVYLPCPWFQLIPPPTEKKQPREKFQPLHVILFLVSVKAPTVTQ